MEKPTSAVSAPSEFHRVGLSALESVIVARMDSNGKVCGIASSAMRFPSSDGDRVAFASPSTIAEGVGMKVVGIAAGNHGPVWLTLKRDELICPMIEADSEGGRWVLLHAKRDRGHAGNWMTHVSGLTDTWRLDTRVPSAGYHKGTPLPIDDASMEEFASVYPALWSGFALGLAHYGGQTDMAMYDGVEMDCGLRAMVQEDTHARDIPRMSERDFQTFRSALNTDDARAKADSLRERRNNRRETVRVEG